MQWVRPIVIRAGDLAERLLVTLESGKRAGGQANSELTIARKISSSDSKGKRYYSKYRSSH